MEKASRFIIFVPADCFCISSDKAFLSGFFGYSVLSSMCLQSNMPKAGNEGKRYE